MVAATNHLTGLLEQIGSAPTAQDLVNALVPESVDIAQVFLVRDDRLQMVASRHIDPAYQPALDELARIHRPLLQDPRDPVAAVIRTGEPRLSTWVRRQDVERATSDVRVHEIFDVVQPRNIVVVPLERESVRYGAIVVAMSSTSRRFIEGDLEFMCELATRVGPILC
jgi:hypothetical protein